MHWWGDLHCVQVWWSKEVEASKRRLFKEDYRKAVCQTLAGWKREKSFKSFCLADGFVKLFRHGLSFQINPQCSSVCILIWVCLGRWGQNTGMNGLHFPLLLSSTVCSPDRRQTCGCQTDWREHHCFILVISCAQLQEKLFWTFETKRKEHSTSFKTKLQDSKTSKKATCQNIHLF